MGTIRGGHHDLHGVEILLADDSAISRRFITSVLEHAGVHVTSVANGAEAVTSVLKGVHYDLVLMDIEMPQLNGYQATRLIRSHEIYSSLPIIGLTGLSEEAELNHCLEVGMNDCLGKPFNMERIYDVIEQHVDSEHESFQSDYNQVPIDVSELPPLPGVDTKDGLARAVGNVSLYKEVLLDFANRYKGTEKQLLDYIASGQKDEAGALIHKIKGVAGTLGVKDLYRLAGALNLALKGDHTELSEELLDQFFDELALVLGGLSILNQGE